MTCIYEGCLEEMSKIKWSGKARYKCRGEESQRNQRENAATRTVKMGKTNAIKGKQRNTAIHLLTQRLVAVKETGISIEETVLHRRLRRIRLILRNPMSPRRGQGSTRSPLSGRIEHNEECDDDDKQNEKKVDKYEKVKKKQLTWSLNSLQLLASKLCLILWKPSSMSVTLASHHPSR